MNEGQQMTEAVKTKASLGEPKHGKIESANKYLGLVSTLIGVVGGVGALFVWCAANFYVGDVEIQTSVPVDSIIVKAYDHKGQETTFHTAKFQLMPGSYHLDISPVGAKHTHSDVQIQFAHKTVIPMTIVPGDDADSGDYRSEKRHWWQFWRS